MSVLDDLFAQTDKGIVGGFFGELWLRWDGPSNWWFAQRSDPFSFVRPSGEHIVPGDTFTDGGSIPKPFWNLPGLDPAYYMKAYLLHDYFFRTHEKGAGKPVTFDEANTILAEMLIAMGCPRERVRLIYEAVELGGRSHWATPVLVKFE